jgi:hypothetical protein
VCVSHDWTVGMRPRTAHQLAPNAGHSERSKGTPTAPSDLERRRTSCGRASHLLEGRGKNHSTAVVCSVFRHREPRRGQAPRHSACSACRFIQFGGCHQTRTFHRHRDSRGTTLRGLADSSHEGQAALRSRMNVNRLGVPWFERAFLSRQQETTTSPHRPRDTRCAYLLIPSRNSNNS